MANDVDWLLEGGASVRTNEICSARSRENIAVGKIFFLESYDKDHYGLV